MSIAGIMYTVLVLASSAALIRGVVAAGRPQGPDPAGDDHGDFVRGTWEAAFLSGGPARLADALIAGLHDDGRLVVAGPGVVGIPRPTARNPAEQAVIDTHRAAPSASLHWLRAAVTHSGPVRETGDALAARGLLMRPGPRRTWRTWAGAQLFACFLGFLVASMLTVAQYADDAAQLGGTDRVLDAILHMVPASVIGFAIALGCLSVTEKQLTAAGRRALDEYVASSGHLTGAAHLVATRGLAAAHPDLRAQLIAAARVRRRTPAAAGPHLAPSRDPGAWGGPSGFACSGRSGCGSGSGAACSGGGLACSGGSGYACSSGGGSACSGGSGVACSSGGGGSSCSGGGGGGGGGSSCSSSSSSF
ncbi:TIGR04222 domain-containing membrane protein [Streptomyces sp. WAC 01529]|uniref:TIGR04222 domain-containing membrane protein n=1 Tax=Streptomyces sp. WAC 01529 TaxID=2203205 RepID=UPI000F6B5BAB|nr:TIGR04222 domain-containing membrane protein [Streptomyces sp. WAC 01529]AZM56134.1 TIGR04222 domain-containing membrane protein [Streptomyces sp. WAC 01529]